MKRQYSGLSLMPALLLDGRKICKLQIQYRILQHVLKKTFFWLSPGRNCESAINDIVNTIKTQLLTDIFNTWYGNFIQFVICNTRFHKINPYGLFLCHIKNLLLFSYIVNMLKKSRRRWFFAKKNDENKNFSTPKRREINKS